MKTSFLIARPFIAGAVSFLLASSSNVALAQSTTIDATNWGTVTAPVYGTSEAGAYSQAEFFAGPNKFGSYYSGVLPSGAIVKPAGASIQIGMNPLGAAVTADGRFLITTNNDEREGGFPSFQNAANVGGYTLTVIDTATMAVVSKITTGLFYIGLQVTGTGPYKVWASGGPDNDVKAFRSRALPARLRLPLRPESPSSRFFPATSGYVSNYTPDAALNTADASGNKPAIPKRFQPHYRRADHLPGRFSCQPGWKIPVCGLQWR